VWVVTQPPKNPVEIEPYERWKKFCKEENIPLIFEAGLKVDFEDLLRASDFCFTTSIKEGFGMVYMEPWLINTPVIGRNLKNITNDLEQSGMRFPLLYDTLNIMNKGELTDFGRLEMQDQMHFIRKLDRDNSLEKDLFGYNAFLRNLLNSVDHKLVSQNKKTILLEYSLENYGQRLKALYKELTG
jgi:glycosyltransferase involved in cell wall biosynthesis